MGSATTCLQRPDMILSGLADGSLFANFIDLVSLSFCVLFHPQRKAFKHMMDCRNHLIMGTLEMLTYPLFMAINAGQDVVQVRVPAKTIGISPGSVGKVGPLRGRGMTATGFRFLLFLADRTIYPFLWFGLRQVDCTIKSELLLLGSRSG